MMQHLSALIDMRISMLMMELELDVQMAIFIQQYFWNESIVTTVERVIELIEMNDLSVQLDST